jgi:hypothetical protein
LDAWWHATLNAWPVAFAWMLLTGIVVSGAAIASDASNSEFLRWLAQVPMTSSAGFLGSLGDSPDASTHLLLKAADLSDYRAETLAQLAKASDGVVSLRRARALRADSALAESAEQWIDILERLQMTHGFLASRDPLTIALVSLPAATSAAAAEARLRVVQHLARQLDRNG